MKIPEIIAGVFLIVSSTTGALFYLLFLAVSLSACAPSIRIDVRCVASPSASVIVMDCADQETWKEWQEEQKTSIGKEEDQRSRR